MSKEAQSGSYRKVCLTCGKEFTEDIVLCPDDDELLTPVKTDSLIGTMLSGKYEILEKLGAGGMGLVYKAKHTLMKRMVAIKIMLPQLIASVSALKRFKQEAQAASSLNHPNILTVYDFGVTPDGMPYLVMDFLEGTNLSKMLDANQHLPLDAAVDIFIQAASGLGHAHRKGIVHRDLKPANIMLVEWEGRKNFVKVVDFGMAKITGAVDGESEDLTKSGEVFGSPLYMSPEQCMGKTLDARSDIYSFGCVMYRVLTGVTAVSGQSAIECFSNHVSGVPRCFAEVVPDFQFPPGLEEIVFKAMAKEPEQRYQSMDELKDDLVELARKEMSGLYGTLSGSIYAQKETNSVASLNMSEVAAQARAEGVAAADEEVVSQTVRVPSAGGTDAPPVFRSITTDARTPEQARAAASGKDTTDKPAVSAEKQSQTGPQKVDEAQLRTFVGAGAGSGAGSGSGSGAGSGGGSVKSQTVAASRKYDSSALPRPVIIGAVVLVLIVGVLSFVAFSGKNGDSKTSSSGSGGSSTGLGGFNSVLNVVGGGDNKPSNAGLAFEEIMKRGHAAFEHGDYAVALDQYNSALALAKEKGRYEKQVPEAQIWINKACFELGKYDEALEACRAVLKVRESAGQMSSPEASEALNDMGEIYLAKGNFKESRLYLDKALKIRKTFTGPEKDKVAETMAALGNLSLAQNKPRDAVKYLSQALSIAEFSLAFNPIDKANIESALGQAYQLTGKLMKARDLYEKALDLREKSLSPDNPAIADSLVTLGSIEYHAKRLDEAREHFERALDINKRSGGSRQDGLADAQFCLAMVCKAQNDKGKAQEYAQGAYEIRKTLFGEKDDRTVQALKLMQSVSQ